MTSDKKNSKNKKRLRTTYAERLLSAVDRSLHGHQYPLPGVGQVSLELVQNPQLRKLHAFLDQYESLNDTPDRCWEWPGNRNKGYPRVRVGGHLRPASHVVYERVYGPIPKSGIVRQRCHNLRCLRPEHLFVTSRSALRGWIEHVEA